ncbi:MAG: twin-arginine translocase TatA/TatE family subunit, partial [Chloroflexota bacterium]|nr:twin-arginine translocase TatA/TatE family subunit [Chloroflexota bacterium]
MNVFGVGPLELMVLMIAALIIFGPQKLPEIGAQIGKAIRDFRQMSQDVTGEFNRTMTLDAPPPPADLQPDPALSQEAIGANGAAGANGAGGAELQLQTIGADYPGSDIAAEEPSTPPAGADSAGALAAT